MITFESLDRQFIARTDAEGSDHYRLNLDRIPAFNGAQYILTSVLGSRFEDNRKLGESLRDLNKTAVFQTSFYGKIEIDALLSQAPVNHKLWDVLAVYPEFTTTEPATTTPDPLPLRSSLRSDVRIDQPLRSAKRITQEQWANMRRDPFMPGNSILTSSLKEYCYLFATQVVTTIGQVTQREMTVTPHQVGSRALVAVSYMKTPNQIPLMPLEQQDPLYASTLLEWPESVAEIIVSLALRIAAYKQGDQTTTHSLSTQELQMLLQALA